MSVCRKALSRLRRLVSSCDYQQGFGYVRRSAERGMHGLGFCLCADALPRSDFAVAMANHENVRATGIGADCLPAELQLRRTNKVHEMGSLTFAKTARKCNRVESLRAQVDRKGKLPAE
jgi:hypothetical protein